MTVEVERWCELDSLSFWAERTSSHTYTHKYSSRLAEETRALTFNRALRLTSHSLVLQLSESEIRARNCQIQKDRPLNQMQQQDSSRTSTDMVTAISSPSFSSQQQQDLIPIPPYFPHEEDTFVNLYSSIFHLKEAPPPISLFTPHSISHSTSSCDDEEDSYSLYAARLAIRCRQMEKRYSLCLARLHDATQELDNLRQENVRLRKANVDLTRRLNPLKENLLLGGYERNCMTPLANELRRLSLGGREDFLGDTSRTLGYAEVPTRKTQRVSLPKSISVRSTGYLKRVASGSSSTRGGRVRVPNPVLLEAQHVYPTASPQVTTAVTAEQEALEFDVFTQGMFKTELCNKWEENGECPYGDHCQFAHGVDELRPVIRHPRYKTEVCRMVLAGEMCPYGHRCHFRHALCPEDH